MSAIATAVVGGAVISGALSANAAQSAANTQAGAATQASNNSLAATQESNQLQWEMYQQSLVNQSPYMQTGQEANQALASFMGLPGATASPGGQTQAAPTTTASNPQAAATPTGINPTAAVAAPTTLAAAAGNQVATPLTGVAANGAAPVSGVAAPVAATATGTTGAAPAASTAGAVNSPGIGNIAPQNYGATQSQLNAAAGSVTAGQGSSMFNNTDLNAQMAPNYEFQLQQGQQALEASMAASGTLQTGQGLKNIQNYAQNTAAGAYQQAFSNWNTQNQNIYNRLSGIVTPGTGAATAASAAGVTTGGNIANTTMSGTASANNYLTGAAAANAAGTVGVANAISGSIGSGVNGYMGANMYNQIMNNANNSGGGGFTAQPTYYGGGGGFNSLTSGTGPTQIPTGE
jgi:hypothetical protein